MITNLPPEEVFVTPVDVITMDTAEQRVLVQFVDPDEDALVFTWLVDGEPVRGVDVETFQSPTADGTLWSSRLVIRRAEVESGVEVTCLVTDLEDLVRVDWVVEVP